MFCDHHFNYYLQNRDYILGYVICFDDLHLSQGVGSFSYHDVHDIMQKVNNAENNAEDMMGEDLVEVIQLTFSTIIIMVIYHILTIIFVKRLRISKFKKSIYILLHSLNIVVPICLFLFIQTNGKYEIEYIERVNRSFLYDIPAVFEFATEHDIDTEGKFRGFTFKNSTKQNNSTSVNGNNCSVNEVGKFEYYEDANEIPQYNNQGSSSSYDQGNFNNDRRTEYKEPCRLCGGDGKCFSIRANTSAAMEMYCNGSGVCNHCNGQGYVNNSYLGVDSPMKCTYCNGTGSCQSCHGTGVCNACHGRGH